MGEGPTLVGHEANVCEYIRVPNCLIELALQKLTSTGWSNTEHLSPYHLVKK